jgi:hypothetical protein
MNTSMWPALKDAPTMQRSLTWVLDGNCTSSRVDCPCSRYMFVSYPPCVDLTILLIPRDPGVSVRLRTRSPRDRRLRFTVSPSLAFLPTAAKSRSRRRRHLVGAAAGGDGGCWSPSDATDRRPHVFARTAASWRSSRCAPAAATSTCDAPRPARRGGSRGRRPGSLDSWSRTASGSIFSSTRHTDIAAHRTTSIGLRPAGGTPSACV